MEKEHELIKELKNYKYEVQYFLEKSKDIDKLKNEIEKSYARLIQMKEKNIDTKDIHKQLNKIIEKQSKEENALLNILTKKQKIERQIENLPQPFKNVIFFRYICGYSFDTIASKMNYSTKRIYQLHNEGLQIYIKMYG